ncbi:uncharacterized protein LOC123512613 [Portunus trituberculatus]|uniref:uncharacterized protein LOC123512613 n=1 Tax=Portunus trituberculatus TaxID=210409 RepID=UPI001E1CFCFF|nr:uncharacterized protein LOC123512613 [Portunus trituberculatus]XP_045124983.1 uncharacterized protein LOC123512613 [Portunus trituberculatus]XP_045124984.1 uncharacterized protein LOC123512613 [Portunus trituberculatus]XP_045124985.1 uncharacterized protein LOC123512613 [Portunus trituberculatus]
MQCHAVNRSTKVLVVVLVTLASCISLAPAQIHWNRGWGAGGSMGKRSPSSPSSSSSSSSVAGGRLEVVGEETGFLDCSGDLTHAYNLLLKVIETEASRLAACELRSEGAASPVTGEREGHLPHTLPWWKSSSTDQ